MQLVGSVAVTFTEADFPDAEYKMCDDGIYRQRFSFMARVLCGHYTRTLRVRVTSRDGRRELGRAIFQYE
jgi:hypothetical protein